MFLLDPIYGVSDFGRGLAKWMNRLVLVAELCVIAQGVYCIIDDAYDWWIFLIYAPLSLLSIGVTNLFLRAFWNIFEVIVYGTTDTEELRLDYEERQQRRAVEKMRRNAIAYARQAQPVIDARRNSEPCYLPKQTASFPDDQPDEIVLD